jgi:hypothetical protein
VVIGDHRAHDRLGGAVVGPGGGGQGEDVLQDAGDHSGRGVPAVARRPKRGVGSSDPGMISFTLPEIRRLLISLIQACSPDPKAVWSWSRWRRRRQYQARLCHYKQRGYAFA